MIKIARVLIFLAFCSGLSAVTDLTLSPNVVTAAPQKILVIAQNGVYDTNKSNAETNQPLTKDETSEHKTGDAGTLVGDTDNEDKKAEKADSEVKLLVNSKDKPEPQVITIEKESFHIDLIISIALNFLLTIGGFAILKTGININAEVAIEADESKIKEPVIERSLTPVDYYNDDISDLRAGKYDKVLENFSRAIEMEPTYAEAYNERGMVYCKLGQYDEAISDYSKVIEQDSKNASAYRDRGMCYYLLNQYKSALANLNKSAQLNPNDKSFSHILNILHQKLIAAASGESTVAPSGKVTDSSSGRTDNDFKDKFFKFNGRGSVRWIV